MSLPQTAPANVTPFFPWVRSIMGDRHANHPDLRALGGVAAARLAWWALGVTPTARVRAHRFRESIVDGRGLDTSLYLATSSGA